MAGNTSRTGLSLLSLGDSYSIGEGVASDQAWPAQLVSTLRGEGLQMEDALVLATTGWTTDELLDATTRQAFEPPYALVTLLIGVNNQYRGRSLENYASEFSSLLDLAVTLAGGKAGQVIVVSIPDWGVTPFAREQGVDSDAVAVAIDRFNACARERTGSRGAHWVDVTAVSRGSGRDLLADDGLHPSAGQYTLWMQRILPLARQLLQSR